MDEVLLKKWCIETTERNRSLWADGKVESLIRSADQLFMYLTELLDDEEIYGQRDSVPGEKEAGLS